jgi:predicted amidohydrolase
MTKLRISTIQTSLRWEDKLSNLTALADLISRLGRKTDVVVLPEMFSTGFSMQAKLLAEPLTGKTVRWMQEQAKGLDAVVTGSFIAAENGQYFNRLVWMQPDGSYRTYDKRHLFSFAGEGGHYAVGRERLVVDWRGWKVCPLICYDLRFPVWSRNTENYDLLLYVANWPARRRHAWKSLLVARAMENQCYVVGVNRIGPDGQDLDHAGDTSIVNFAGELLYQASEVEDVMTLALDREALLEFRANFRFLADRDKFRLEE